MRMVLVVGFLLVGSLRLVSPAWAQDPKPVDAAAPSAEELAKKLANPIASLISVPFQSNFEFGAGQNDQGFKYTLNVQPVIPASLSVDWNLIPRVIVPVIYQDDVFPDSSQAGLGDTVLSLFFSPKEPGPAGLIWGIGPVGLLPTATNDRLGAQKWGLGPTAVVLKQDGPWTYGALVNHIWGSEGVDSRKNVNATFLQPFLTYGLGKGLTVGASSEMTYDWIGHQWTIPVIANVAQIVPISGQLFQFSLGVKYYAEGPSGAPDWGIRFVVTLLFPQ